jgi:hypothetical protein
MDKDNEKYNRIEEVGHEVIRCIRYESVSETQRDMSTEAHNEFAYGRGFTAGKDRTNKGKKQVRTHIEFFLLHQFIS